MKDATLCVATPAIDTHGFASLSVPVSRASTIPFPDASAYLARHQRGDDAYTYGLSGTPTSRALEQKIARLEGGTKTVLVPSGLAAISFSILPFVATGDRVLICDTVYPPVREFAYADLARLGVDVAFYDPTSLADLQRRIDARTRIVWVESPGSATMEIQDLPGIVNIAHAAGALVGCDNTWATPLNCKPLAHGADIVAEALTKWFAGHSDVLMGSITTRNPRLAAAIKSAVVRYGLGVSPDDCSLVLRGIETLAVRLSHSAAVATHLAERFSRSPVVDRVLCPSRPDAHGHAIWRRDFLGCSGVFSVVCRPGVAALLEHALDALELFSIGASWGGTHSLMAPMNVRRHRSATVWEGGDAVLRISVGLEAREDLEADVGRLLAVLEQIDEDSAKQ
jgi:cysteine-S-conjugate beta-lyase